MITMTHERATDRLTWWRQPLALALAGSLLLHAVFYGTWQVGRARGWWDFSVPFLNQLLTRLNTLMVNQDQLAAALERHQRRAQEEEMPLMFVDVAPQQATTDAPEKPKFYSALNSTAANQKPTDKDEEMPKLEGQQERIVKTRDVPRNNPAPAVAPAPASPAQPVPEPAVIDADKLQPSAEPETKASGKPEVPDTKVAEAQATKPGSPETLLAQTPTTPKPGDLARALTATQPDKGDGSVKRGDSGEAEPPRPRTVAQARAQLPQDNSIAGQQMKAEGGVRRSRVVSVGTLGTMWGSYDAKLIAIIQNRWFQFLDETPGAFNFGGRVRVKFQLWHDGSIKEFSVEEKPSNLDASIEDELQVYACYKAIIPEQGQLYDPWPPNARKTAGKDYRELRFTFYYN